MLPNNEMKMIINRKIYNTATATLLCGNDWWDGSNRERGGTNKFLYRTKKGSYFFQKLSQWQGASDRLEPCNSSEAAEFYSQCQIKGETRISFEEAFPGLEFEEA
jgi:hypothetical protein